MLRRRLLNQPIMTELNVPDDFLPNVCVKTYLMDVGDALTGLGPQTSSSRERPRHH